MLDIRALTVRFETPDGPVDAVRSVDLAVHEGEVLGVVGESGSGKSQTFMAAMGLIASNGRTTGQALFRGRDLLTLPRPELDRIRGSRMTMIFQDPLMSLTPHMTVGDQLTEVLTRHKGMTRREALARAGAMLDRVRIPEARRRLDQYPHELSGGMRQRVMIAMATLCEPDLLVADEPTTALDVTVQAQILEVMKELGREMNTAICLITHDMGVVAGLCDRIQVMRDGAFVEEGTAEDIFERPREAYTRMLLEAMPRMDRADRGRGAGLQPFAGRGEEEGQTLLQVRDLKVHFPVRAGEAFWRPAKTLRAVDGVAFDLRPGETLGIVGESGCGKSTLARAVLRLVDPSGGAVIWQGRDLMTLSRRDLLKARADFQMVFQDPLASLDPRMTIGESIAEPLDTHRPGLPPGERKAMVRDMMVRVGLDPAWINRYPHEFSGGQNQRAGLARAMILRPRLIVCDEATSALDVSIQAQIVDLILDLQREFGMAMLFISHDIAVVRQICHRIMVLYMGRVVELADRDTICTAPRHPYTRALMAAVPVPDPSVERHKARPPLPGDLPSPLDTRSGLTYLRSRMIDDPDTEQYVPKLIEVAPGHLVAEHDLEAQPGQAV
ncbi:MAG: dipeptide ABC transporter ATP-binding protein [Alphaproteobacteria bacterium]